MTSELHGAGGLSGSQHASLEAQGASGAGRGMDPRQSPQRVWDPGLGSGGGRPGTAEQRGSGEAHSGGTVIDAKWMADSAHAESLQLGHVESWGLSMVVPQLTLGLEVAMAHRVELPNDGVGHHGGV